MTKTEEFIIIVQTGLIVVYCSDDRPDSPGWAAHKMADAFRVAKRIPASVSAGDAAEAFLKLNAQKDLSQEERAALPEWVFE